MYQVIICTINTGRVQRKSFESWDAAWKCSETWKEKNDKRRVYAVSIERVEPQVVKPAGRTMAA